MNINPPIRHGDWHLINGELVDISQNAESHETEHTPVVTGSDVDDGSLPISLPPIHPAPNKRRKSNPED